MSIVGRVDAGTVSFLSGAAITKNAQVKVSGSKQCTMAVVGEAAVGVCLTSASASLLDVDIKMYNAPGTFNGVTASAVAAGAVLYTAAAGAVNDATTSGSGGIVGIALTAGVATAGGDTIEFAAPGPIATT
jgi:hypothetical protein